MLYSRFESRVSDIANKNNFFIKIYHGKIKVNFTIIFQVNYIHKLVQCQIKFLFFYIFTSVWYIVNFLLWCHIVSNKPPGYFFSHATQVIVLTRLFLRKSFYKLYIYNEKYWFIDLLICFYWFSRINLKKMIIFHSGIRKIFLPQSCPRVCLSS